jgi:hypothetical protein
VIILQSSLRRAREVGGRWDRSPERKMRFSLREGEVSVRRFKA